MSTNLFSLPASRPQMGRASPLTKASVFLPSRVTYGGVPPGSQKITVIFKHDLVAGSFIPPADIRQLRDLVRYRWKLTNFTTGEKNRAQNCLTVSNIKLDDVFSDVFGKAATAITSRLLENPTEKISDVSAFRTKGLKATDEQILAAVDGEMCAEQAEKLRIIRSHMDSLELCKLNLESLILNTAEF
ncbi:MAG: hypothetical protein LUD82_10480 [Clostridiales bacterium]|nr:hypothetical protein [Clostridiales bacterium]